MIKNTMKVDRLGLSRKNPISSKKKSWTADYCFCIRVKAKVAKEPERKEGAQK